MHEVEPKVFLIAQNEINWAIVSEWFKHLGLDIIPDHIEGSDTEQLIEFAGRRCYKSFAIGLNPNITKIREDSKKYHQNILESKHGSVLEHGWATFAFEDVSRIFTHELVRHRQGTAMSQESLRFVLPTDIGFWIPPELSGKEERAIIKKVLIQIEGAWSRLKEMTDFANISFDKKKQITSALRRILPIGITTGIVFSFNMRALRWIIEMRTSIGAEIEMRFVFNKVAIIAKKEWPMIFSDFVCNDSIDPPEWHPDNSKV